MSKLQEFLNHLIWHSGKSIYVWGGQGEALTDLTEQKIRDMETSADYANRAIKMWNARKGIEGARAFDCSGLVGYLMEVVGVVGKGFDTTANGFKGMCKKLSKSELKPGDAVFKIDSTGKAYHIGIVVDNALNVVEAAGRDLGVVCRSINANGWNWYGRLPQFENEIGTATGNVASKPVSWTLDRLLKNKSPYMRGTDVMNVQKALISNGYSCGSTGADGVFGSDTDSAVRAFQKAKGLTVDGIVGENTCTALGGTWK